jgi:hypothetical protein
MAKIYGDFGGFGGFWAEKNKAKTNPILFSPQIYLGVENPS